MRSFFGIGNGVYFSRSQRLGLIVLLFLISGIQVLFFTRNFLFKKRNFSGFVENKELVLKLDSIRLLVEESKKGKVFSFNPNFITDERAYFLEMSIEEYDRLKLFREQGKFVNNVGDFQSVTGVSDAWLLKYGESFRFPDWVTPKKNEKQLQGKDWGQSAKGVMIEKVDINQASKEMLMEVRGIGEVLSERILKEREKFGAFVSVEQFGFIWGIKPEVAMEMEKHFVVMDMGLMKKVNINRADRNELKLIPYLNYGIALDIIKHRSMNGDLNSIEDLREIKNIPLDKLGIINLYLDF